MTAVTGRRGRRLVTAALAGAALHLAFPGPGWDLLGLVALAPVLALAATAASPRAAMAEGWVAGCAFFGLLLRWLTYTMTTFSAVPLAVALLVLLLLAAYLALFWAVVSGAVALTGRSLGARAVWLAPAFWVAAELLRTYLLSGFPWGLLGYVPYRRLALIQIAAWTGVYGVSALLALVNALLAYAALRRTRAAAAGALLVAGLAVGGAWLGGRAHLARESGAERLAAGRRLRVGVVQGNIPEDLKWDATQQAETLRIHEALTREAAPGSDLVIWPEAAVPVYLRDDPRVLGRLSALAARVGTPLLVGAPDARADGRGTRYVNSALLVDAGGVRGRYDKMHLVPFGEYVPLKRLLFFVEAIAADVGDFTPGPGPVVLPLSGAPFGTVICYEVIFPDLFRQFVAEGASFMANITNDAWFGDSAGPRQHLAMVPLRAVENGVAVVRAANTGISAIVLPSGAIQAALPLGQRGVLRGEIPLRPGGTFYTRAGDVFARTCGALALAAVAGAALAARRRS